MTAGVIEKEALGRVWPLNPFKIIMGVVNWLDPAAVGRGTMELSLSAASRSTAPPGQRLMNDYFSLCNMAGCGRPPRDRGPVPVDVHGACAGGP